MIYQRIKTGWIRKGMSVLKIWAAADDDGFPAKSKAACENKHGKPCEQCRVATIIETGKDCE